MPTQKRKYIKGVSLRHKILLPFFLILILLGCGATLVSVILITEALSKTADERLMAFQTVVFREIKKQEILLGNYAHLLQSTLYDAQVENNPGTGFIPKRLLSSLREANISLAFYRADEQEGLPSESMLPLFQQASRSGKPRFRFSTNMGSAPALAVAAPANPDSKEPSGILYLQSEIDRIFLKQVSAPFHTHLSLHSPDGKTLVTSEDGLRPLDLTAKELETVLTGQKLIKTEKKPLPHRRLYSAIPLGTTDLIILSLDLPMADLGIIVNTLATGSVLAISLALLLGGYIYYRLIRQIMSPVKNLVHATQAVGEGNLDYRIRNFPLDELGQVAESFNAMTIQLKALWQEKVSRERQLTLAQEELRHKEIVEQKNLEIEATNRELKAHLKDLSALFQLNQAMISTLDLNVLFDRILSVLEDVLKCQEMVLLLYNPGVEELEIRKTIGIDYELLTGVTFRLDEGITGTAARTQKLLYVRDISADERNLNYKRDTIRTGSMVSVPLVVKNKLGGVLNLHKERVDAFTEADLKMVQAVANQAAIAVENARLYERARDLSNTDELTNLANRRHFQEILLRETAHAKRYHSPFCLIMADIDHFKLFNDTHGHLMGDMVLKKVASILLQNTRGIDLVGRFGGEEFVVLLPKTDKEGALAAAEKLRRKIGQEIFAGAEQSQPKGRLTLSLGVAEFPGDSNNIYELLDLADRALYIAKEAGRNRTEAWSASPLKVTASATQ